MMDMLEHWNQRWRIPIESFVRQQLDGADPGHGIEHIHRVVSNALRLAEGMNVTLEVLLPAAWLHDCVSVPKNAPERNQASRMSAERAVEFLQEIGYPRDHVEAIRHCIEAHSFSAGIACETDEARIVQDADRLEAVGAIGLARCLMTGGALGQRLYEPNEPFPVTRMPRDCEQSVDHFFAKLLGLHRTMQTESGRREGAARTHFLVDFLKQLAGEIGVNPSVLTEALTRIERD
jgi:uncharacterized protein